MSAGQKLSLALPTQIVPILMEVLLARAGKDFLEMGFHALVRRIFGLTLRSACIITQKP